MSALNESVFVAEMSGLRCAIDQIRREQLQTNLLLEQILGVLVTPCFVEVPK